MIRINKLHFTYDKNVDPIFKGVSLDFPRSGIVGLIGRNGAGKTTLFDLICGNYKHQSGDIDLSIPLSETLLLGQNMTFPHRMTALEAIEFVYHLNNLKLGPQMEKLQSFFQGNEQKRWEKIKDRQVGRLSNGELKWLCVVLSLSLNRKIYLLDEPTDGVDPEFRYAIWQHIHRIYNKDKSKLFIISSHLLNEMGDYIDDIFFLKEGEFHKYGNIDEFIAYYNAKHADEAFVLAHKDLDLE